MNSLYERLEEADAFITSVYPKLAWRDLSTIVVSMTELHLQDVTVLSEEVYSGPMGESLRKLAVKRMLLNVGKKMQGKCINCDKQFRNMLPKEMNAIHGSHIPNHGGKLQHPSKLCNLKWVHWKKEFEILLGFECCRCHAND